MDFSPVDQFELKVPTGAQAPNEALPYPMLSRGFNALHCPYPSELFNHTTQSGRLGHHIRQCLYLPR